MSTATEGTEMSAFFDFEGSDVFQREVSRLATEREAVAEYALNVGRESIEDAWILSPFDTWERNPFYSGPAQPHPEDDRGAYGEEGVA
jgi:hypothetical protein